MSVGLRGVVMVWIGYYMCRFWELYMFMCGVIRYYVVFVFSCVGEGFRGFGGEVWGAGVVVLFESGL